MKIQFKVNFAFCMMVLGSCFTLIPDETHAQIAPASRIVTKQHETTYRGSETESLESMKISVKEKLKAEFIDLLPSYIHSVKSVSTTGYDQNIRFVVGSLINIHNEKYEFDTSSAAPIVTLKATVQFDEMDVERNIAQLEKNNNDIAIIQSLINNDALMQSKIERVKMLYAKTNDPHMTSTIDAQIKTLVKLRNHNSMKVTVIMADSINDMVLNERKKKQAAEKEAAFKKELAEREKMLASMDVMSPAELQIKEAATLYAKALNDYYMREITAPRTLKVKSVDENSATFEIVRVDGKPIILPWKYSFDEQLAYLFDQYSFAKFSNAKNCNTDYVDSGVNTKDVDGFNSTFKANGEHSKFAMTGITVGRYGSHKPLPYSPLGKNTLNAVKHTFNRFSPTFNSPFLYYYARGELRVHHVDPTDNGAFDYDSYVYVINIGNEKITLPFMEAVKKQSFEPNKYRFNAQYVANRDLVIAPYRTEGMYEKEKRAYLNAVRNNRSTFVAPRNALKSHYLDPQTPMMSDCGDEYIILKPTITLTNDQINNVNEITVSVVKA